MRALELDFQHPPRPSIFGWLILLAGLAALVALLGTHRMLAGANPAARRATIKRIEALLPGAGTPSGRNNDAALTAARQVMERPSCRGAACFRRSSRPTTRTLRSSPSRPMSADDK